MAKDDKIKLVQIIADSDLSGGPAHVLGILRNINKLKFDLYLISPSGDLTKKAEDIDDVTVIKIPMKSKYDLKAKKKLNETLSKIQTAKNPFGPMIVHTHGPRAGFLGRMALPTGVISVYTEHRWDKDYQIRSINGWLQKSFLKWLNKRSDLVIAVSSSVKNFLVETKMAPSEKIKIIPNAIEIQHLAKYRGKPKHTNHPPRIGSVGNLNIQKGYLYLIEAMVGIVDSHNHSTLEIIGEGPERKNLQNKIRKLGLERNVTLLGRKDNPLDYMKHWDIFILSSIAETFGIVVLEAMKSKLPVVATKVGGVVDIIDDKESGILINPKNPEEIEEAALELINRPALAARLVRGGSKRVKKFDWKIVIERIEKEYLRLVRESGKIED